MRWLSSKVMPSKMFQLVPTNHSFRTPADLVVCCRFWFQNKRRSLSKCISNKTEICSPRQTAGQQDPFDHSVQCNYYFKLFHGLCIQHLLKLYHSHLYCEKDRHAKAIKLFREFNEVAFMPLRAGFEFSTNLSSLSTF